MNEEDALVGNTQWREGAGAAQELKMGENHGGKGQQNHGTRAVRGTRVVSVFH